MCYSEMIVRANKYEITMGSNWIDLKRSSQYAFTNLKPMKKQPPTEGLGQAIFYYSHLPGSPY